MMKNPVFAGGPIADENTFTASYRLWKNRIKKAKNVDKSVDKVDYSNKKGSKMLKNLLFAEKQKKTVQKVDSAACNECVHQPQPDIVLEPAKFKKQD